MLVMFSEVEGDDSCVVVAVEKRETAIYLKRCRRSWEEAGECIYKNKNCIPSTFFFFPEFRIRTGGGGAVNQLTAVN